MKTDVSKATIKSNFDLKNHPVVLIPAPGAARAYLSVRELEGFRAVRRVLPASKHGLEVLCGGSCETGAQ